MHTLQDKAILRINHRIDRLKKQVKHYDIKDPHTHFNYFGGKEHGRLEGKISALGEILEELIDGTLLATVKS